MFGSALIVLEGDGGTCSREIELSHSASYKRPFGRSQASLAHSHFARRMRECACRLSLPAAPQRRSDAALRLFLF